MYKFPPNIIRKVVICHDFYIPHSSAQSNNEQQHNRTNTTIAALSSATPDTSYGKPNPYQQGSTSANTEYEGISVEFRLPDTQQQELAANQSQNVAGDADSAARGGGQHNIHTNLIASGLG